MLYVVKNDDHDGFSLATVDLSGEHRGVRALLCTGRRSTSNYSRHSLAQSEPSVIFISLSFIKFNVDDIIQRFFPAQIDKWLESIKTMI